MKSVLAIACAALALAHPIALEGGTDATTRLKVGGTIMYAPVVAAAATDTAVQIVSTTSTTVTFKADAVFFAIRASGAAATIKCHEGFNISNTANCTNQAYLGSALPVGSQTITCDHTGASAISIGYGVGAAISLVTKSI